MADVDFPTPPLWLVSTKHESFSFPPQLHGLNVLRWKSPLLSSVLHWHMRSTGHFRSGASSEEGRAASLSLAHLIAELRSRAKLKELGERSPLRKTQIIDKLGLGRSRGRFGLALRRYTKFKKRFQLIGSAFLLPADI